MQPLYIYQELMETAADIKLNEKMFVHHFNNTQREINNLYGDKYTLNEDTILSDIHSVKDGSNLRDEYSGAVADRILYLHTKDAVYEHSFGNKVSAAYIKVWKSLSKGKRVKKNEWR